MLFKYFYYLVFLFVPFAGFSQTGGAIEQCASVDNLKELQTKYPKSFPTNDGFETWLQETKNNASARQSDLVGVVTIPVVVHIIHNETSVGVEENITLSQVESQIKILNNDFRRKSGTPGGNSDPDGADIEIEFCLARLDPMGNPIDGVNRLEYGDDTWSRDVFETSIKPATIWDPEKYFNIWLTKNIGGDATSTLLGWAQFPSSSTLPGIPGGGGASTDGVVMRADRFGSTSDNDGTFSISSGSRGRTLTHEVGHWLGLRHIWGDGGCDADDYCDDTPSSSEATNGCPGGKNTCGSPDMIENYMDYTNDICMNIFTNCQKERMRTVLENSPRRANLINSNKCTGFPDVAFTASSVEDCGNTFIQFDDQSTPNPTAWSWSFPGGEPSTSTEQNPEVFYGNTGTFDVILAVTNNLGTSYDTLYDYINITNDIVTTIYQEDFNDNHDEWTIENTDFETTWQLLSTEGDNSGALSLGIKNYNSELIGQRDAIISPAINLSSRTEASLSFEYAYRGIPSGGSDSLIVYVSVDDGDSYTRVYQAADDGNNNFYTNSTFAAGSFSPNNSNDWCYSGTFGASCVDIDLTPFVGSEKLRLKFENFNNGISNLYLDNISVSANCISADAPPIAGFIADVTTGCNSLTVNYQEDFIGFVDNVMWTFEGGTPSTSTDRSPTVTYSALGTYDITLEVSNVNGSNTILLEEYILVTDMAPTADFTVEQNNLEVIFTDASSNGATYLWDFGDGKTSQEQNPIHHYRTYGDYTVTLTVSNGCDVSTTSTSLTTTGINDPSFVEELIVYPNPSTGQFNVQLRGEASQELSIKVYNLLGQDVYNTVQYFGNGFINHALDLSSLSTGTYFVQIQSGKQSAYRKVIKN